MLIPIKLPKEHKDEIVQSVQAYFQEELSEPIGNLAAERLLDFMIKQLAPYLYNKGIADARVLVVQKAAEIEDELYSLEVPIAAGRKKE